MKTVAIFHPDNEYSYELKLALQKELPLHKVIIWKQNEPANYLVTWKPDSKTFLTKNLEIIFGVGAGVDSFVSAELPKNIQIIRLEEAGMGNQMFEFALYGTLTYSRDLTKLNLAKKNKSWLGISTPKQQPFSTKVGVMGMGQLGAFVAKKMSNMGYAVSGYSISKKNIKGVKCYSESEIDYFLNESEVLINLLPLTKKTKNILNMDLFNKLPKGAFLINIARGGHLQEEDLIPAIESEQLQGAMLDVFKTEPLPKEHPFWNDDRIIITPHLAAITTQPEAVEQISNNIIRYEKGMSLTGSIDLTKEY